MPPNWESGEPAKGKRFGRWTECVGVDGAYFWDADTDEVVWEIPAGEIEAIKDGIKEIQQDKKERMGKGKGSNNGTQKQTIVTPSPVTETPEKVLNARTPSSSSSSPPLPPPHTGRSPSSQGVSKSSSPTPKRASVVMRDKQLSDIKAERAAMAAEKVELEKLKTELLQMQGDAVNPAGGDKGRVVGSHGPRAPKSRPPSQRRTSAVLGKIGQGLTIADGFSVTNNHRGSVGLSPGSEVPPIHNPNVSLHTAKSSAGFKNLRGKKGKKAGRESEATSSSGERSTTGKRKNESKFARQAAGPTLAKAFFPEKSSCQCCFGYIYGCDEQVCHELGKCICSLEEGEGTGDTKKKKGKYEFLEIKSVSRKKTKSTAKRVGFQVEEDEENYLKLTIQKRMVKCLKETFTVENFR